ncbi:Uncharacterised protein (plasmid) [Klebsiella aerogenes]|nr:Uncharacterised protein [Klebsiella aerogenes]
MITRRIRSGWRLGHRGEWRATFIWCPLHTSNLICRGLKWMMFFTCEKYFTRYFTPSERDRSFSLNLQWSLYNHLALPWMSLALGRSPDLIRSYMKVFSKASIRHDEFQINKAIWLHLMFHLPPLVTAKCLPRSFIGSPSVCALAQTLQEPFPLLSGKPRKPLLLYRNRQDRCLYN